MEDTIPDTPQRDTLSIIDDDHETVATIPISRNHLLISQTSPSQRLTQPTQIIEKKPPDAASVIQVAASSPAAPQFSPSRPVAPGGLLSSLVAPSGTQFRSPWVVAQPTKRVPVLDTDDEATYRGGSSDDELDNRSPDIKPALFGKSVRAPDRIADSPSRPGSAMNKFKEITASAFYSPSSISNASLKRPFSHPSDIEPVKRPRQNGPSRAQPVQVNVETLDDIDDYQVKAKVQRMMKVLPQKTVRSCTEALLFKKGNYEDALDYLASLGDEKDESSEDELSMEYKALAPVVAPAKQQIKAREKIQDKWTQQNLHSTKRQSNVIESKPRRRLIRGARSQATSPSRSASANSIREKAAKSPTPQRSESPEVVTVDSDNDSDVEIIDDKTSDSNILNFLNTCSVIDLSDIAAISEDIANFVISHRPFKSLHAARNISTEESSLDSKFAKGRKSRKKPIGDKVVDKCLDMLTGYQAVDTLVSRCEELGRPIAFEMKKWGVNIFGKRDGELDLVSLDKGHDSGIGTPSGSVPSDDDADMPKGGITKSRFISQPSIMSKSLTMKDYQIVGINWLSLLFEKELSCILADDMGLGKTCQVIGFLAHLLEKGIKGPHLIVVPSSTLENWLREFNNFCPTLSVMPYYAGQAERAQIRETIEENRDDINVVITTYTVAKAKIDAHFLRHLNFCVCVYDEGHMLKNSTSVLYEKLIRIPARFRLLLTGTPLQNNLQELASLLGFILPNVFQEKKDDLQYIFANRAKTADDGHSTLLSAQRIARAKSMLTPFVLRRKKHQVIDLPTKLARVEYCTMNEEQKKIYQYEQEEVGKLLADRAAGKKTGNKSANILMKLRQAAIHPLLYRRLYDDTKISRMAKACLKEEQWSRSDPNIIFEELQAYNDFECHTMCKTYPKSLGKYALTDEEWMNSGKVDKLVELLTKFKENGDRTLVFSQFTMVMDILEYVLETIQMSFYRLDGRTSVEDRQAILDAFHENLDVSVFLLSTKAGGAGINLACANKVIIFDSSFNPQEDVQAENRAHRVGQTREVEVIRFVTTDTIEEKIYALGQTKLALDQRVVGDDPVDSKKTEDEGIKAVEKMVALDLRIGSPGE